mmetsp:Transcript_22266/g.41778  ORF Transcript_22266/g.41778 Transcript_22266/m.41778 type:complete len:85 (-) Transcript_22266:120-374(-)
MEFSYMYAAAYEEKPLSPTSGEALSLPTAQDALLVYTRATAYHQQRAGGEKAIETCIFFLMVFRCTASSSFWAGLRGDMKVPSK